MTLAQNAELCARCNQRPIAEPRITKSGKVIPRNRCLVCLDYAKTWQKGQTAERRDAKECITCGSKDEQTLEGASRCERCSTFKSKTYNLAKLTMAT